jgi:hypothetical protein
MLKQRKKKAHFHLRRSKVAKISVSWVVSAQRTQGAGGRDAAGEFSEGSFMFIRT